MKQSCLKTLFALLTAAGLAAGCCTPALAASEPGITCSSAILMEANTGAVLFEYNADDRHAPASITKIMTMLLVSEELENGTLSETDMVTASEHACSMGGSQIWLEPMEQMSVQDMLRATAIGSANDAAVALGEHVSGSEPAFVERMNARAAELGMENTSFRNACGLDEDGHYTTARDIALMSRELLRHENIKQYTSTWMDTLRGGETELTNTNRLVRFYSGCTGLKTGTTDNAGYCLSASAERDGLELIAVVLGDKTSEQRFASAKALLDYGFANYCAVPAPDLSAEMPQVRVLHGVEQSVLPQAAAPQSIVVEKAAKDSLTSQIEALPEVQAPVQQGQKLGSVKLLCNGKVLTEYDIIAPYQVPKITLSSAFGTLLGALCGANAK